MTAGEAEVALTMNDEPKKTGRWQFSIRRMLAVTAVFSACCAFVAHHGYWYGPLAWTVFMGSACGGSFLATRRAEDRHVSFGCLSVVGGAVGASLVMGSLGFAREAVYSAQLAMGMDPEYQLAGGAGIYGALYGFFLGGAVGLAYGIVGAVHWMVRSLLHSRFGTPDDQDRGDSDEPGWTLVE